MEPVGPAAGEGGHIPHGLADLSAPFRPPDFRQLARGAGRRTLEQ